MSNRLEDYRPIVGSQVIDELLMLADRVRHLRLQHINSTSVGGGVRLRMVSTYMGTTVA